MTPHFMHQI